MGDIDWGALLEGKEPTAERILDLSGISGLHSVGSDISISGSTTSRGTGRPYQHQKSNNFSDSGSLVNLQSVNDLLAQSPSPEPYRSRSAASFKSNVTFSESEPEVFNIAEEINLLSIADLMPSEQESSEEASDTELASEREYTTQRYTDPDNYTEPITEEHEYSEIEDEISEDIKTKSEGWKAVKDRMINKGRKIPVFMVGPKKKAISRDLSFNKSLERSELSQLLSTRKSSKSTIKTEASSRKSSIISEKSTFVPTTYNYSRSSYTEDITTVSDSSEMETVTKSSTKTSITNIKFAEPCCKCKCKCQAADLNIKPVGLRGTVLDPKTLSELAEMNPDKIALLNIMKAQYHLTKGLLDITSGIINSEIDSCQPTARYTSIEETRRYIKKNQPYKKSKRGKSRKENRPEKT